MNIGIYRKYRGMALRSMLELHALRRSVNGSEVIVLGSGPSIQRTDLSRLDGMTVIYLNNALELRRQFRPGREFLCLSDHLRAVELRPLIDRSDITCMASTDKIFNPRVEPSLFGNPLIFVMPKTTTRPDGSLQVSAHQGFSDNLEAGIYLGKSVVFPAIQFAYHLGAQTISLVGVDMTIGAGATYFSNSIRSNWSAFNYDKDGRPHFLSMAQALKERHVSLLNCSCGGKLDAVPRMPLRFSTNDVMKECA